MSERLCVNAADAGELLESDSQRLTAEAERLTAEQLDQYGLTVSLAVGGDMGAIAELYKSRVLDKIASYVAHRIGGAHYWDQAISKEDIVQMAVCEVLSSCTDLPLNQLRNVLYAAARNNVIDIFRRQNVVRFEPLSEASDAAFESPIHAEIEHRETVRAWNAQLGAWLKLLKPVDRFILKATLNNVLPRDIARSLYQGDWTKLSNEERKQRSDKVSKRLYKLKEKLAAWLRGTHPSGAG